MAGRIEDYALIGDMQSAALVCRDGSVDWFCVPRFDSPACFAALLGDERHGHWRLAPMGAPSVGAARPANVPSVSQVTIGEAATATRRYRGDTLILETEWRTPTGIARVIDFMPPRGGGQPAMVRLVEGVHGTVDMEFTLRIRPDYGRIVPWVRRTGHAPTAGTGTPTSDAQTGGARIGDSRADHSLLAIAGPDAISLRTPIQLTGEDLAHRATFRVEPGQRIPFVLTWRPSHLDLPQPLDAARALRDTERFWRDWVAQCAYDGEYKDAVIRSLITLKALTYHPTGGIVAAATTSLPEDIGGVRNWDYRYCWLRDATITLEALLRTGYTAEAAAWRAWLERAIAGDPRDVQIMYGVGGERRLTEWTADWLPGYEGSAPVRIGNAAARQFQLDVYGEVLDALHLGRLAGMTPDRHAWSLQRGLLDFVEKNWNEPDEGLWEVRGPRRHFVHSKIMAWVAFDRAAKSARSGLPGPRTRWARIARRIHDDVCRYGFDSAQGAFTQAYGSAELDAAVLLMPEVGFLPPDDPRVTNTVEAITERLMADGFVRRYELGASGDAKQGGRGGGAGSRATRGKDTGAGGQAPPSGVDGLPGSEGAFLACSFWLANALDMIGRRDEAIELFERLLALRNDVGLLSEEYDPRHARQVGNTPQAFSHVPLVQTALNLGKHACHHGRRSDGSAKP
ncbi:MAG: glycoside hydrolase family 15 protein [Micromonosporaceae bacterium]